MSKQKSAKTALTTVQQLGSIIKSARDIMRKDKGLNGDLDRLPMLTWIMFLKFLDDMERMAEQKSFFKGKEYRPAIESPYRWRDWAANERGLTGDDLMAFINNEEVTLTDGAKHKGLFAYLRALHGEDGTSDRRDVISTVFKGVNNRMVSGYLLRDVVNKINAIHFNSTEEIHTLGRLYESMLREMRDAAGDSGEFYTPRPVIRFMVEVTNPRLGETVLDPACGTGGFLVEAFLHLLAQCQTVQDRRKVQTASIYGGEAKPLPYMLTQMNLLLHGMESPQINPDNSLKTALRDITDKDRVDIILTNPPFGGEEERGILPNFPDDRRTAETALLFLQLIMRKLKRTPTARAALVVPNGTLFGGGIAARIKEDLLTEFNLHTIVRLPKGVFSPYADIPSNLLFFDRSGPTKEIWYYEHPLPEGRKSYTKTTSIQYEHFADCLAWWNNRKENERAWKVDFKFLYDQKKSEATPYWEAADKAEEAAKQFNRKAKELGDEIQSLARSLTELEFAPRAKNRAAVKKRIENFKNERALILEKEKKQRELAREERTKGDAIYWPIYNLDIKNPRAEQSLEHLPPEQLVEGILNKELRIEEIIGEIKRMIQKIDV
ncbi:MAG TPA: class I SAM-dependent DNA methyltransferase [Pyrinomonadaceae bacterium]|jgi:type I restriction enzyme M protein